MLQDVPTPSLREAYSCVLETERLTLRRPTLADAKAIARLANDRRIAENTRRLPHPYSQDHAVDFVRGIAIDKNDNIYVADSQSTPANNAGFKQGVRIGNVKDGKVTAFIPEPSAEAGTPEGVGVDEAGNVYGGYTAKMAVKRFVKN